MKITDVKIRTVVGIDEKPGGMIYDNKKVIRVAPTDIHPEYKKKKGHISVTHVPQEDGTFKITHNFLVIETDENIEGVVGPISNPMPPVYIYTYLKPILVGQDPWDVDRLWDIMYRSCINGRKGENMQAISYVDCALWDIRCKAAKLPLYKMLGGKVQKKIRAYANTAGYPQDLESVETAGKDLTNKGFTAIKWGIAYGPAQGEGGIKKTVEIFRTLRETVGNDISIFLDAWSSWDVRYTLRIAERLKEINVCLIEEPVLADLQESYQYLNDRCCIPISGGEHEYTRWGFKSLLDKDACALYQPDPAWSGGISECRRIIDLISCYDRLASIHNSLPGVGIHVSCTYPTSVVPIAEYLMLVGEASQYFLKTPCRPVNGYFEPLEVPGIGMDIDESKVSFSSVMENINL